jgi:Flp pilus assembly protein TadD
MLVALLAFQSVLSNADYQRGVEFFRKGQFDTAIPFLIRATEALPRDARTWKALGVAYAAQSHYDLAEPSLRRACDLDPKLEGTCY